MELQGLARQSLQLRLLTSYMTITEVALLPTSTARTLNLSNPSPSVDYPTAEIKKRLIASKDYFYVLFLHNFECFFGENNNQEDDQLSTAAALSRDLVSFLLLRRKEFLFRRERWKRYN